MENLDAFPSSSSSSSSSSYSLSVTDEPMLSFAAASASSSSSVAALEDAFEDACSICLEPFSSEDPPTVTSCKHEYHLQCILEWSQRSKECPICWQLVVLKDRASQELLAAIESERLLRSRSRFPAASTNEDYHVEQDSYSDDSDVDEHITQHLAAAASRVHSFCRREMRRSPGHGPSEFLNFAPPESVQQTHTSPEGQSLRNLSPGSNSPHSVRASATSHHLPSSVVPPVTSKVSVTSINRDAPLQPRFLIGQSATDTPQGSEMSSFSESIKSKWSIASARYKESISRSTQGIKEKLLVHNNSVKELSKGVQQDVSAGIAGVARMIERLDLTPKRTGPSSSVTGFTGGNTNFFTKGKELEEIISPSRNGESNGVTGNMSLNASVHIFCTIPDGAEVNHVQRDH